MDEDAKELIVLEASQLCTLLCASLDPTAVEEMIKWTLRMRTNAPLCILWQLKDVVKRSAISSNKLPSVWMKTKPLHAANDNELSAMKLLFWRKYLTAMKNEITMVLHEASNIWTVELLVKQKADVEVLIKGAALYFAMG